MSNATINSKFLEAIDDKTRFQILDAIAAHYGITHSDVIAEITDSESEHILDYLTGATRTAASLLMKRHGLAA